MQQAKEAAKDVAVKKEASLPTTFNLEESAGQGQEFVTARDTKLPILKILYSNSPVLDESDGKYIEAAKQGDIYNETSGNLFKGKDGLIVVPCLYINTFNEWKDRGDSPGRPVGIHMDPAIMSSTNRGDDGKVQKRHRNFGKREFKGKAPLATNKASTLVAHEGMLDQLKKKFGRKTTNLLSEDNILEE